MSFVGLGVRIIILGSGQVFQVSEKESVWVIIKSGLDSIRLFLDLDITGYTFWIQKYFWFAFCFLIL